MSTSRDYARAVVTLNRLKIHKGRCFQASLERLRRSVVAP
jgi:hypothetical protein